MYEKNIKKNKGSLGKRWMLSKEAKEKHRQSALKQFKNGMPQKTKTKIRRIIKKKWKEPIYRKKSN